MTNTSTFRVRLMTLLEHSYVRGALIIIALFAALSGSSISNVTPNTGQHPSDCLDTQPLGSNTFSAAGGSGSFTVDSGAGFRVCFDVPQPPVWIAAFPTEQSKVVNYTVQEFEEGNEDRSGVIDISQIGSKTVMTSYAITQHPPVPIITSFVGPRSIIEGEAAFLSWKSKNGKHASIDQGIGDVGVSDEFVVTPTSTTTYTLTVENGSGQDTKRVTVIVNPPPPGSPIILSFTANPPSINPGQSALLTWQSTDGTRASINNGVGDVMLSGSVSVSPASTTTYTLTVSNATGSTTARTTTVNVITSPPGSPVIATFTATPSSIVAGESALLSWQSSGGTSAIIDNDVGTVDVSGSAPVFPTSTTTYHLKVTNSIGSAPAETTVTVTGFTSKCPVELSPKMAFVGEGEEGHINSLGFTVTPMAGTDCSWTASTNEEWIVLADKSSHHGKGAVTYTVKNNNTTGPRCGNIFVAGMKHTVIQAAKGSLSNQTPECLTFGIGQIKVGDTVHGTLTDGDEKSPATEKGGDFFRDRYEFNLESEQAVAINVASADFDPFLYLLRVVDGKEEKIACDNNCADDDGAGFTNSRLPRLPAKEQYLILPALPKDRGKYVIDVTSFSSSKRRGNYALYVASKDVQNPPVILTAIVDQESLIVVGENFAQGATLRIGDIDLEATNDGSRSRTALIAKKGAKNVNKIIKSGSFATLRVVNGSVESEIFVYPSPPKQP